MKFISDDFLFLQSQFLCNVPIKQLKWKNLLDDLNWDDQKQLLDKTINLNILEKYPINTSYAIRFLRHIIDTLEAQNVEIHDELYEVLCNHQTQSQENCNFSYKHYKIVAFDHLITLKEAKSKISEGTTGLNVWEAALALCEWAIKNKEAINSKHLLELGSGTGLSGLVIAKCCNPASMALTDGNDKVLEYLRENVQINNSSDRMNVLKVDWIKIAEDEDGAGFSKYFQTIKPNLIVAADVIYDNSLFQPLCQTLDFIFRQCNNQCIFILVNAVRNENTLNEFFTILGEHNFSTREIDLVPPTYLHWEINSICPIKIYHIERNV